MSRRDVASICATYAVVAPYVCGALLLIGALVPPIRQHGEPFAFAYLVSVAIAAGLAYKLGAFD